MMTKGYPWFWQDEKQGKMLLHTEHSLLSLLEGEPGVVQKHTSFVDTALQVLLKLIFLLLLPSVSTERYFLS
jgi:hypothetical protein